MAIFSGFGIDLPFKAASDMDSYQYRFVKLDTVMGAPYVNVATGASNPVPLGVLMNDPHADGAAIARVAGVAKVLIGGSAAISVGQFVKCGSVGWGELIHSTSGSGYSGIALEDITASGGYISILLRPWVSVVTGTT